MKTADYFVQTIAPVTYYENESILKFIENFLSINNLENYSFFNLFLSDRKDAVRFVLKCPTEFKENYEVELKAAIVVDSVNLFKFIGKGESCAKAVLDAFIKAKSEPMIKELSSQFDEGFIFRNQVVDLFKTLIDASTTFEEVWNEYLQSENE